MLGNVRDWCHDGYDADAYKGREGTTIVGLVASRVFRGGCLCNVPAFVRSAYCNKLSPELSNFYMGFRLAQNSVKCAPRSNNQVEQSTELP